MGRTKKKIKKIFLISTVSLTAVLILINSLLNLYLEKAIVQTFNDELNVQVKIDHVRINFFTSKIKLYGFTMTGMDEFKNDTLIHVNKASIKLDDFDNDKNIVIIDEFFLNKPLIYSIDSELGNNNWNNALQNSTQEDSSSIEEDLNIFINNIIIENGELIQINKLNKSQQSITNLCLNVNSSQNKSGFTTNYDLSLFLNSNLYSDSIKTNGTFIYKPNLYQLNSIFQVGDLKFNIDGFFNADSISEDKVDALLSFSFNDLENTGNLKAKINVEGFLSDPKNTSISTEFIAEDINIKNQNHDNYYFDGNIKIAYYPLLEDIINFSSDGLTLISNSDTICGNYTITASDSIIRAKSNFINSDSLQFNIKENTYTLFMNSNLSGFTKKEESEMNGELIIDLKYNKLSKDDSFDINLKLKQDSSYLQLGYNYDSFSGLSKIVIPSLQSYYKNDILDINVTNTIERISIKETNNYTTQYQPKIKSKKNKKYFPSNINLAFSTTIKSFTVADLEIKNINYFLKYSPSEISLNDIYMNTADGSISGKIGIYKEDSIYILRNNIKSNDIDLGILTGDPEFISGKISFQSINDIYFLNDSSFSNDNYGVNTIDVRDFQLKSGLLKKYEIEEDYFRTDSASFELKLIFDQLILVPTSFIMNDANIAVNGYTDLSNGQLLYSIHLNTPKSYFSPQSLLLLQLVAKEKEESGKIHKNPNRVYFLLEVCGEFSDIDYNLYSE